ncbi:MAG: PP2C family protein-serine/threonine phosphatase [Clostridiales bacterium]|nr:PP2C family protein-serine/threonine phosphatase [Clostridiales bacterium]
MKKWRDRVKALIEPLKTEDVLWNNEVEANFFVSRILGLCEIMMILALALELAGVFQVGLSMIVKLLLLETVLTGTSVVCTWYFKGNRKWLKYLLCVTAVSVTTSLYCMLDYDVMLLLALPVVLSCRYYSKKFTKNIAMLTTLLIVASTFVTAWRGMLDLNYVTLKSGTMEVGSRLLDSVMSYGYDKGQYLFDLVSNALLSRLMLFSIIAAACTEFADKGHKMILEQQQILTKTARISTELSLATDIQTAMLPCIFPAFPEHEEVALFATMNPAKEVGGDFYDYFRVDDDHIAFLIADVSGKGVGAALFMMIAKTLLKNEALSGKTVEEICSNVNQQLCENNDAQLFVTCWMGILTLSTGTLSYVNAGHNPPLICRKGETFEYIRGQHDVALAFFDDSEYHAHDIPIQQGDALFLYTDGVTEAQNEKNELYGEERLREVLNKNIGKLPHEMIPVIKEEIEAYCNGAEQFDDITMLMSMLR